MEERKRIDVLLNGLIKENPVLVLVIGTCPTLATSTSVETGFGMGLAATAVLVCSNIVISALHNIIPDKVRIPCFITVIAGFVTIVQMLLQAFVPSLYSALGLYLPLIVVNCIILGRAEMFASKNGVLDSALDGIGMGLGFTLTLVIMGTIREVLGSGTWLAGDWFGLAKGFKGIPLLSNFIPAASSSTRSLWRLFIISPRIRARSATSSAATAVQTQAIVLTANAPRNKKERRIKHEIRYHHYQHGSGK